MGVEFVPPIPPLIDCGAPAHYVTGCKVDHIGNGVLQFSFYREDTSCGECIRQIECKILLHCERLPEMRLQTDLTLRNLSGTTTVLLM